LDNWIELILTEIENNGLDKGYIIISKALSKLPSEDYIKRAAVWKLKANIILQHEE
jgi:hypothetical protein